MSEKKLLTIVASRSSTITDWLVEHFPAIQRQQRHLDETSVERGYWHLGYQAALSDILALTASQQDAGEAGAREVGAAA